MSNQVLSVRPFLGAKDFQHSRAFYSALGFTETPLEPGFSLFQMEGCAFYLQDADVPDWIANSQVFLEVADVQAFWERITQLNLPERFPGARISPPRREPWGTECFIHDPSGILWHIGKFHNK
ncbi:VOC family protein [Flaviaesturariibacter terrae]